MELRTGAVSRVHRSVEAGGNQHGVWTSHVYTFVIGTQAVELAMPRPPQIEDGDDVDVAGMIVNGTLVGRAYRNRTTGTSGRWQRSCINVVGLVFIPFILGAPVSCLLWPTGLLLPLFFCLFAWPMAISQVWAAWRTNEAVRLVNGSS